MHASLWISAALSSSSSGNNIKYEYTYRRILNKPEERAGAAAFYKINRDDFITTHSNLTNESGCLAGLIVCEKGLLLIDRPIKTSLTSKLCAMLWSERCQFSRTTEKPCENAFISEILAHQNAIRTTHSKRRNRRAVFTTGN